MERLRRRVLSFEKPETSLLIKEPLAATTITFAAGKYIIAKLFHIAKRYITNPKGIYITAEQRSAPLGVHYD